jgi:hypothetical protein
MVRAESVLEFCQNIYGTEIDTRQGAVNLFAFEGCNVDLTQNADLPDQWNDTIAIIQFVEGKPTFTHLAQGTSEPGLSSTMSKHAARLGGVARIAIGWHKDKWRIGFHQKNSHHPALVQAAPITVHRDRNRDGKRIADPITMDVQGLNWHSTRPNLKPVRVGGFSAGCIVGRDWNLHIDFIVKCRAMQLMHGNDLFSGTVVDWSRFVKWLNEKKT